MPEEKLWESQFQGFSFLFKNTVFQGDGLLYGIAV